MSSSANHKICAIIPTYNRCDLIGETIESVLAQTRPADEVIVVNDGSTDGTEAVVRAYGDQVRLITKENGGKASALNLALEETKAEYIWICDDDDVADEWALEHLAGALYKNPKADMAIGDYEVFRVLDGRKVFDGYKNRRREGEGNLKINFLEDMFTFQFAMLVRRSAYERVGDFNEAQVRSQDYEMVLRLSRGNAMVYVPKCMFYQRQHEGMRGSGADSFAAAASAAKWMKYDQMIFEKIYEDYDLEEFCPSFARDWGDGEKRRACLVERACVMAKRGLWTQAVDDLAAAVLVSGEALSLEEFKLVELVVNKAMPWETLAGDAYSLVRLTAFYSEENEVARALVFGLMRPLVWHVKLAMKQGHFMRAVRFTRILFKVLGMSGAAKRLRASVAKDDVGKVLAHV